MGLSVPTAVLGRNPSESGMLQGLLGSHGKARPSALQECLRDRLLSQHIDQP